MGVAKLAIGDAVITLLWVAVASTLGALTTIVSDHLQIQPPLTLVVSTSVVFLFVSIFNLISEILGHASFNPTGTVSFYAAGVGDDSLFSMAVRLPAQVVGAVGGVMAVNELMPKAYKDMLEGPLVKVDLQTAAIAEGVLTFAISFVVLFVVLRGPKSSFMQNCLMTAATMGVVIGGAEYTGPSLNPANAYGWAYITKQHNTWEQFYVYWIPPFLGSILAALFFRLFFSPPKQKVKEA